MKKILLILVLISLFLAPTLNAQLQTGSGTVESGITEISPTEITETKTCPVDCTCVGDVVTCPVETPCVSPCIASGDTCACPAKEEICPEGCVCKEGTTTCPSTETIPVEAKIATTSGIKAVSLEKTENELSIKTENAVAITTEKLVIEQDKLSLKTSAGNKEIKILPEEASSKATEITTLEEIKLEEEDTKPVYSVKGTKDVRILSMIPASMEIETKVSAETGDVISTNKPWWSFLAW